jgi:hypothetical protein
MGIVHLPSGVGSFPRRRRPASARYSISAAWKFATSRWTPSPPVPRTLYFIVYDAIAETFAVVVEAILIARTSKIGLWRALLSSIVANSASGLVGLICSWLTGFP